jgi:hypothetical protein
VTEYEIVRLIFTAGFLFMGAARFLHWRRRRS